MAAESASPPTAPETSHFLGLAKQTLVYGLSGVALQAVGVIALPIYGHLFSQAEFGLLELATVLSAVALALIERASRRPPSGASTTTPTRSAGRAAP